MRVQTKFIKPLLIFFVAVYYHLLLTGKIKRDLQPVIFNGPFWPPHKHKRRKNTLTYTWSYENRVSKHFVIFLNVPWLIACLLCCLLMSFFFFVCFFAWFVIKVLCRSGCTQNYYLTFPPPPLLHYFSSLPTIICLRQLFEISARLKRVSVPFSSLVLYIGHPEKSFPESIM